MTLAVVHDVLKSLPFSDVTIDSKLAFTTGTIVDYSISTLHDIIRFHCKLIDAATLEILLTTSY